MIGLFVGVPVLILECPTWLILHVTVEAVSELIKIVNPGDHSSNPCYVLVVVLCAVLADGLAHWAGVLGVILTKLEILILLQRFKCVPLNRWVSSLVHQCYLPCYQWHSLHQVVRLLLGFWLPRFQLLL